MTTLEASQSRCMLPSVSTWLLHWHITAHSTWHFFSESCVTIWGTVTIETCICPESQSGKTKNCNSAADGRAAHAYVEDRSPNPTCNLGCQTAQLAPAWIEHTGHRQRYASSTPPHPGGCIHQCSMPGIKHSAISPAGSLPFCPGTTKTATRARSCIHTAHTRGPHRSKHNKHLFLVHARIHFVHARFHD